MNTKRATDNTIHADIGSAFSTFRKSLRGCVHTVKKWRDEHRHTQALSRLNAHLLSDIGEEAPPSPLIFNAQSVNNPLAWSDEISFRLRH